MIFPELHSDQNVMLPYFLSSNGLGSMACYFSYLVIVIAKILLSIFNFQPTDPTVTWKGYMISLFIDDIRALDPSLGIRCFHLPKV